MGYELWVQLAGYIVSGIVALLVAGRQHSKTIALLEYRLQKLEESVSKHNNLVERIIILEQNEKAQWKYIDKFKGDKII